MDLESTRALRNLNLDFYEKAAESFSRTRRAPWAGWYRAWAAVAPTGTTPRVLDLGCGNGRFLGFLDQAAGPRLGQSWDYVGLDSSSGLLEQARLRSFHYGQVHWVNGDLLETPLDERVSRRPFDAILLLAVLHHIPGAERRMRLVRESASRLSLGGCLVVSLWRFAESERGRKAVRSWSDVNESAGLEIDPSRLEVGDHALGWGPVPGSYRYCHHFSELEVRQLAEGSGLELIDEYRADGESDEANHYLVLRRSPWHRIRAGLGGD